MKVSSIFPMVACALALASSAFSADLKQSKFTQIVNDVKVVTMPDKNLKPATVNELFKMPDILRTGPASRAELVAEDKTITRVGANTVFSFDAANRTIDLEKGSLLFHSPKGKGGGQIKTGSATAAVLGTTIIVSSTPDGGFKLLVLEGTAKVTLPNGQTEIVKAGQEVFVLPGGGLSPVINFRLDTLVAGSKLVNGFDNPLPSSDKIGTEIAQQEQLIINGKAVDTGLLVGDGATVASIEAVDPNSLPTSSIPGDLPLPGETVTPTVSTISPVALTADVTLDSPRLDTVSDHLFLKPTAVSGPGLSGNFVGLFGHDINFVSGSETIDLFPFESLSQFTFLASHDININQSVDFFGSSSANLSLVAAGSINIAADSGISYAGPGLFLQSGNAMSYDTVAFENTIGLVDLQTLATMSLNNCFVLGGDVNLTSAGDMTLNNTTVCATGGSSEVPTAVSTTIVTLPTGIVNLTAASGSLTVNNSSLTGETLNASAAKVLTLDAVALNSFNAVNLAAHTLILQNVNFAGGSSVLLKSDTGLLAANPNTGATPVAGYINFVNNVTYGGQPAQNFIGNGITLSKLK